MPQVPVNSDLSENVAYNIPEFPVYIRRGVLSDYPDFRAVCHWHTDFEFIYVFDGSMDYSVNGSVIPLNAGQGIFVNSNCLHYGFSDKKSECRFLCILLHPALLSSNSYFHQTVLSPLTDNSDISYIKLRPSCPWQNEIILALLRIEKSINEKNEALNILQSFITIISAIIDNTGKASHSRQEGDDISALTAMIGFIQQNYPEKISIKTLASAGGCCKTRCNNLFRKYLSMTPLNYLTEYRLDKSTELLLSTGSGIADIAYTCGFSGSSYYCETFKKYYGITPKLYRISHNQVSVHN